MLLQTRSFRRNLANSQSFPFSSPENNTMDERSAHSSIVRIGNCRKCGRLHSRQDGCKSWRQVARAVSGRLQPERRQILLCVRSTFEKTSPRRRPRRRALIRSRYERGRVGAHFIPPTYSSIIEGQAARSTYFHYLFYDLHQSTRRTELSVLLPIHRKRSLLSTCCRVFQPLRPLGPPTHRAEPWHWHPQNALNCCSCNDFMSWHLTPHFINRAADAKSRVTLFEVYAYYLKSPRGIGRKIAHAWRRNI
jgi:hypothetical protein